MKSFSFSRISKLNVLTALCALGLPTFSLPATAVAQEVCVRTPAGNVVCGTPVPNPSSNSASCKTIIRQGATLNWMTLGNGSRLNQGTVTINAVNSDGSFSATTINNTFNNIRVNHTGLLNSSNFTLLNPSYNETWTGSCNQQRIIEGQINGNSGLTFRIW